MVHVVVVGLDEQPAIDVVHVHIIHVRRAVAREGICTIITMSKAVVPMDPIVVIRQSIAQKGNSMLSNFVVDIGVVAEPSSITIPVPIPLRRTVGVRGRRGERGGGEELRGHDGRRAVCKRVTSETGARVRSRGSPPRRRHSLCARCRAAKTLSRSRACHRDATDEDRHS